jgi:hypothetical protein
MLPPNVLRENPENANVMTDEEFRALVAEVGRQGKPNKLIVVMPVGEAFQVVDRDHNLRAALESNLEMVPCEVLDLTPFEAMRQSVVRNLHGKPQRVRLGRLFKRMCAEGNLSTRALSEEVRMSEGMVRNYMNYAEAFELRNSCARDEDTEKLIAALTFRHVKRYLDLPEDQRDEWLDAGADLDAADPETESEQASTPAEATNVAVRDEEPVAPVAATAVEEPAEEESTGSAENTSRSSKPATDAARPGTTSSTHPDRRQRKGNRSTLWKLKMLWIRARVATREKFLAFIVKDGAVLAAARRLVRESS